MACTVSNTHTSIPYGTNCDDSHKTLKFSEVESKDAKIYSSCSKKKLGKVNTKTKKLIKKTDPSQEVFECEYDGCSKTFTNYFNLRRHVMLKHTQIRPFKCDHCPKKFALLQYFQEHLLVHMPAREAQRKALQLNPSILNSLPVFFINKTTSEDILQEYMEAKEQAAFVTSGNLPWPRNLELSFED